MNIKLIGKNDKGRVISTRRLSFELLRSMSTNNGILGPNQILQALLQGESIHVQYDDVVVIYTLKDFSV